MAQSCDRIVSCLRKRGLVIDIVHFTNRRKAFKTETQIQGTYTAVPLFDDLPHSLNLALSFLEQHYDTEQADCMLIFGGLVPMSAAKVYSALLSLPYYLCLRGNDFDISLFSYKRRDMLLDALEGAKGVFCVSRSKQQRVTRLIPGAKAYYTPNGIDLELWSPLKSEVQYAQHWKKENVNEGLIVLGFFGALKNKKGTSYFLQCIKESGKKVQCFLLFCGEMEQQVMQTLEDDGFQYQALPFADRSEMPKYYLACDWVVLPSFYDGMPNVLLEAGGLKIPVLACGVDGILDIVESADEGVLFPPLTPAEGVQAVQKALSLSIAKRGAMAEALYQKIESRFSEQQEADNYIKILLEDGYHV